MKSNYDKLPVVPVSASSSGCLVGWPALLDGLRAEQNTRRVIVVECYPGVLPEVEKQLAVGLRADCVIHAADLYLPEPEISAMVARHLTDDPVFGRMNNVGLEDFFDPAKLAAARGQVAATRGSVLILGTGAALVAPQHDLLVYADLARWEIQMRQRRNQVANLGATNFDERPSLKYKRAFFIDWRAADRLKRKLLPQIDLLLDTNTAAPKMISGAMLHDGLRAAAHRPFRVVPFFDPAPWGGQWMRRVCELSPEPTNFGWCFDCVPEENSLLLGFGDIVVEVPASDLVFSHPRELLGDGVHARFGAEFPIRFDFLDTMGGGNLSLQVHPLTEYIQDRFGMNYTQDESYYMLDAGEGGTVYLGLREGIERDAMLRDLHAAQQGGPEFPAEKYVNRWPAKKHDHFLIPAGTVHCSGRNGMVLEISATPYIFTFKLWDWGRLGLDGRPRPIHLEHGAANIQWDRTTDWVRKNLINRFEPLTQGDGWSEERTGLHEREFIETRRHWFTSAVPHHTGGGVNVLNLCEGREAVVESPSSAFEPYVVHYAETFIIPAAVGPYTIRPHGAAEGAKCATIKAFVRTHA